MNVRAATVEDFDAVRDVAERSFRASYALGPGQIETIVRGLFSEESLAERAGREGNVLLAATADGAVVGVADAELDGQLVLRWLHVDPDSRGEGAGTALFERLRDVASDRGQPLLARVLTEDEEGGGFCEQFGFERRGRSRLDLGDQTFFEYVYAAPDAEVSEPLDASVDVPETVTVDGTALRVDREDEIPGTDGPFFRTYDGDDHEGFVCANCGSATVETDTLGRYECQRCGNKHLADEWDAAYLD